ncbi:MAG: hypothetical protein Q8M46_02730 [Thiobacillus sp.]|nr:hypothetical protein [Thiobacillus sp.]
MQSTRIPTLMAITLTVVALASAHAMSPHIVDPVQPGHAKRDGTQMAPSPGVLDALADENNTLAYVRVSKTRHEAYFNDARARCTMYRGKARATCIDEARMKYVQALASQPL